MTEMKVCKDCKWCERFGLFRTVKTYSKCQHPASCKEPSTSIVTGATEANPPNYCGTMRLNGMPCGAEGRLFETNR